MIIKEKAPKKNTKYSFEKLEKGQCNILDDVVYYESDLHRARSSAYQYRKYYKLIETVEFSIHLSDGVLKIYRTK